MQRHACIHARTRGLMFTCVCYRAHVRARAFSCAHACASNHMCVQAGVTAGTHACIICTCLCFRAHVRARMCNGIRSCLQVRFHVQMRVLPGTFAIRCNFVCTRGCFRSHVRASMCKLRRATLHYWPAGVPQCIIQPVRNVPDKITVVPSTHTSLAPAAASNLALLAGRPTYDAIMLFFTCPSAPAKTRGLDRGLMNMILSYSSLPARVRLQKLANTMNKKGALGKGLIRVILSYAS